MLCIEFFCNPSLHRHIARRNNVVSKHRSLWTLKPYTRVGTRIYYYVRFSIVRRNILPFEIIALEHRVRLPIFRIYFHDEMNGYFSFIVWNALLLSSVCFTSSWKNTFSWRSRCKNISYCRYPRIFDVQSNVLRVVRRYFGIIIILYPPPCVNICVAEVRKNPHRN